MVACQADSAGQRRTQFIKRLEACKTEADGRVVEGNHVVYRISAPTPEEKEEWIKSIK